MLCLHIIVLSYSLKYRFEHSNNDRSPLVLEMSIGISILLEISIGWYWKFCNRISRKRVTCLGVFFPLMLLKLLVSMCSYLLCVYIYMYDHYFIGVAVRLKCSYQNVECKLYHCFDVNYYGYIILNSEDSLIDYCQPSDQ